MKNIIKNIFVITTICFVIYLRIQKKFIAIIDKYKKQHETLEKLWLAKFMVDYDIKIFKINKGEKIFIGFHLIFKPFCEPDFLFKITQSLESCLHGRK